MHWDYNPFYWSSTITFFFYEKIPFNIKKIPEYGFRNFEFNASTYDQLGVKVDQSTFLQCYVYLIIFSMIRYMDCLTESFCNCPLSLTLSNAIRITSKCFLLLKHESEKWNKSTIVSFQFSYEMYYHIDMWTTKM